MDRDINKKEQENTSSADVRITRTQHSMLVRQFVSVMEEYNSSQTIYKDKCKAQVKRQLAISGKHVLDSNELDYIVEELKRSSPKVIYQTQYMRNKYVWILRVDMQKFFP